MDSKLAIEERLIGDVAVLRLIGQMLVDDGDLAFGRRIVDLVNRGITKIAVDMGGVTFVDSSGVGMMAAKLKYLRERGGDMRLVHLTARTQRVLGMMKMMIIFETFDDEAAAVHSFEARPGHA